MSVTHLQLANLFGKISYVMHYYVDVKDIWN